MMMRTYSPLYCTYCHKDVTTPHTCNSFGQHPSEGNHPVYAELRAEHRIGRDESVNGGGRRTLPRRTYG